MADSFSGLNALLVEDNEINGEIAKLQLENMGFSVTWVANGARAVETFGDSEQGFFSIVVMDIMMPVMDGHEATRIIRHLDRDDAKTVPVIAITANAFPKDEEQSLRNGVTRFITKPYSRKLLEETVDELINGIKES